MINATQLRENMEIEFGYREDISPDRLGELPDLSTEALEDQKDFLLEEELVDEEGGHEEHGEEEGESEREKLTESSNKESPCCSTAKAGSGAPLSFWNR